MEREKIPIIRKISEIATYKLSPILGAVKKLLLIRPRLPNDPYTELGSYNWAGLVKQKALDLGWTVTDLAINEATRENVENKIDEIKPNLIIHYDHGSHFTLWGQNQNLLEAAIDHDNVELLQNRITSTVSCYSAAGLGPLAITNGAISYLGYTEPHSFVDGYADVFGEASNAANYALLECKSVEVAYQAGINAYNDLFNNLIATGNGIDAMAANVALHDRDCFVYLGSGTARACLTIIPPVCIPGLPDSLISCKLGLPDSLIICRSGLPEVIIECRLGLPDSPWVCRSGLPHSIVEVTCKIGGPDSYMVEKCPAGPLIQFDFTKLPVKYQKSLTQLVEQIKKEQL